MSLQEVPADQFSGPVSWPLLDSLRSESGEVMNIPIQALQVSYPLPQESGHLDIYSSSYGGNTEHCSRNPNAENSGQYFLTPSLLFYGSMLRTMDLGLGWRIYP